LVVRFRTGAGERQLTLRPSWSSSSYDMVKSHVDRYPAGAEVALWLNPADPDDARYEVGATLANVIVLGALGGMGLLFVALGLWTLRPSARPSSQAPARSPARDLRLLVRVFAGVGVALTAVGMWLVARDVSMLRSWPYVEAAAIEATTITTRSRSRGRPTGPLYDVQVTFRYVVDGRTYESRTRSGIASSSTSRRDELLRRFAPGTRHTIRHRPGDANVIRYELDWSFATFLMSGAVTLMGLVFVGIGAGMSRVTPATPRAGPPDIDAEDREIAHQKRFR
jgi:hypothetical protein